jgi:hypothetical protein
LSSQESSCCLLRNRAATDVRLLSSGHSSAPLRCPLRANKRDCAVASSPIGGGTNGENEEQG